MPTTQIEQQLTILLRRVQRIHLVTSSGEVALDRSAYGIMCRLVDEGGQRLGSLAHAFGLDPPTITPPVPGLRPGGRGGGRAGPPRPPGGGRRMTPGGPR